MVRVEITDIRLVMVVPRRSKTLRGAGKRIL